MSETENPAPAPPPVVLRFRTVHPEPELVLLGSARKPDRHVLVLGLSKGAALRLAEACSNIAEALPDDARDLVPLVLPGQLIDERTAFGIIRAKAAARKAAAEPKA